MVIRINDMMIRKQSNAKIWWTESDQSQTYGFQNMIKAKGFVIQKRSKGNVWWSESDQMQRYGDQ
jgi:hypothetical protein